MAGVVVMGLKDLIKRFVPPSTKMVDFRLERLYEENRVLTEHVSHLEKSVDALRGMMEEQQSALNEMRAGSLREEMAMKIGVPLQGAAPSTPLVVSIASYGERIHSIAPTIRSIGRQSVKPDRVFLWLPRCDFAGGLSDVPSDVICAAYDAGIEIRFTDEDLGPHNKYFWTMSAFPESTVITLDDDVIYPESHLETMLKTSGSWPGCIVALRVRRITREGDGFARYSSWMVGSGELRGVPTFQLIATGVGGVLYPPHCLDEHVFDLSAIKETCLFADDLWLKIMATLKGTKLLCPSDGDFALDYVKGSQKVALSSANLHGGVNDEYLASIFRYVSTFCPIEELLSRLTS